MSTVDAGKNSKSHLVDTFRFERRLAQFLRKVLPAELRELRVFGPNRYTAEQEGYKSHLHATALAALEVGAWSHKQVGSGEIATLLIAAIEREENNLVAWHGRWGKDRVSHRPLHELLGTGGEPLARLESLLFDLFHGTESHAVIFSGIVELLGQRYDLLAFIMFLRDREEYMPIAPAHFDRALESLGVELRTSRKCSWENYLQYNAVLKQLRAMLTARFSEPVSLLDAHSFTWMLKDLEESDAEKLAIEQYHSLSPKDREAVTKARVGQGRFRRGLIQYWGSCALTGLENKELLVASHIKPWNASSPREAVDPMNGLLLGPQVDAAFDVGLISFDDEGAIIVSELLTDDDLLALGIQRGSRIRAVEPEHRPYLDFHRRTVFQTEPPAHNCLALQTQTPIPEQRLSRRLDDS